MTNLPNNVYFDPVRLNLFNYLDILFFMPHVVFAYPNQVRPRDPYFAINIRSLENIGHDYVNFDDQDLKPVEGNREVNIDLHLVRDYNWRSTFEQLYLSFSHPRYRQILADLDLAFVDANVVNEDYTLVQERWEPRAIMDLRMRYNSAISLESKVNFGEILTAPISSNL